MLKKLLLLIVYASTISLAFSQNYKTVEWDILSIKHIAPTTKNIGKAIGFSTEARLNLNDKFSVGLKYEWHFFDEYFGELLRGAGVSTSFAVSTDYYILNKLDNRAFIGGTFGTFNNSAITESGRDVGGLGVGITPRIGYEFMFLRVTGAYNYTFKEDFPNFFTIGIGLNIGGRYKGVE